MAKKQRRQHRNHRSNVMTATNHIKAHVGKCPKCKTKLIVVCGG